MWLWHALVSAMRDSPRRPYRRIRASEAEQLLRGGSSAPERRILAAVLAAAAAPGRPEEYAGRQVAIAGFIRAREEARSPARPAWRRRVGLLLRGVGVVKLVTGLTVLVVAGTAVAAETGNLPRGAQTSAHQIFPGLGVPAPVVEPSSGSPAALIKSTPSGALPGASVTPSADLLALCESYRSVRKHGKKLSPADRETLAGAAGGRDKVDGYCARLTTDGPSGSPKPTGSPSPTGRNGSPNNDHGGNGGGRGDNGRPSAQPGG